MYNETESTKLVIDNNKGMGYIDLMEQLGRLTEEEITLVGTLSGGELYSDELIIKTGLRPERALAALTMLELKGYIKTQPDGRFKLLVTNS
jgi:predicted Rossmann fold nucleotide-binding protein DprA/Smf involved in DNA uptake